MRSKRPCPLTGIEGTSCAECDELCWIGQRWPCLATARDIVADLAEGLVGFPTHCGARELLQPWRIDLHRLTTFFADTAELRGVVNQAVEDLLVAAARRRWAEQQRHYYAGRGLWGAQGEALAGIAEEWLVGTGAELLVPLRPEPGRKRPKTRAATISWEELVRDDESR